MQRKKVYLNDRLVGEASTWSEVHELLRAQGITFLATPGAAEGPTAFYVSGARGEGLLGGFRKSQDRA